MDDYYLKHKKELLLKVECIVTHLMKVKYDRFDKVPRAKGDTKLYQVILEIAYADIDTELICSIWNNRPMVIQ